MSILTFSLYLIIFSTSHAEVLKHEVLKPTLKEFEYAEVCQTLGAKNLELISAKSVHEIECLNKSYFITEFCHKKIPLVKNLTRGFLDIKNKKAVCEMSDSVMVSISCDKRDLRYCLEPKKGCEALRKIYANQLELAHFSMLEKNINCYFAEPIGESLGEPGLKL